MVAFYQLMAPFMVPILTTQIMHVYMCVAGCDSYITLKQTHNYYHSHSLGIGGGVVETESVVVG